MRGQSRVGRASVPSKCCREDWLRPPPRYSAKEWRCPAPRGRARVRGLPTTSSPMVVEGWSRVISGHHFETWEAYRLKVQLRHGNKLGAFVARKIVEALLSKTERESQRIRDRHCVRTRASSPTPFPRVGQREIRGQTVVGMEVAARRPGARSGKRPVVMYLRIDPEAWAEGLRDCILLVFDSPCPQKLGDCGYAQPSETAFHAGIRDGLVVLRVLRIVGADRWRNQQVAAIVAGEERGFCPRAAQAEVDGARKIPRMQGRFGVWARFTNQISREGQPVEDRIAGYVNELAKQILIQEGRRKRVAPDRVLQSGHDAELYAANLHHGRYRKMKHGVKGVAILDQKFAGEWQAALR